MRVDDPDKDRLEQPEECDGCGFRTIELERYLSYGPGSQVEWLCPYCHNTQAEIRKDPVVKAVINIAHMLEKQVNEHTNEILHSWLGVKR
ncbi:hypothetical protein DRO66_00510 [Candidatus Bathyarchaeota archaeon]|nr:MAG: hypothetical protein DRO66_00510 [Candidatus Bathyarchaeota archaeon]